MELHFKHHDVTEIAPLTYRISESQGLVYFYLLIGDEKALLIDNGNACGYLPEVLEALTDKPIVCALTHHHCDHAGGSGWFKEVYCNSGDYDELYYEYSNDEYCRIWCEMCHREFELVKKPHEKKLIELLDGEIFELGNRKITAYLTPGHTLGSMVFTDDREKLLFVGDNAGTEVLMAIPGQPSLEEYLPSIEKMYELSLNYHPWWGHKGGEMTREDIGILLQGVKDILAATDKNEVEKRDICYPSEENMIIKYDASKVFK